VSDGNAPARSFVAPPVEARVSGTTPIGLDAEQLLDQVQTLTRMYVELETSRAEVAAQGRIFRRLHELGKKLGSTTTLQSVLQQVPMFATRELGFSRCVLFLDDRGTGELTVRATDGYCDDASRKDANAVQIPTTGPLATAVRQEARAFRGPGATDPWLSALSTSLGLEWLFVVPLVGAKGTLVGAIVAGSERGADALSESSLTVMAGGLSALAEHASRAIDYCILHWELAVERNLLEAKVAERTNQLQIAYGKMQEDLVQAREFQRGILRPPPSVPNLSFDLLYAPLDLVGGDVYDVCLRADGAAQLFIADATGHGVRASLTTMFVAAAYDRVKLGAGSPAAILAALNDQLVRDYGHLEMRFTALCAVVDRRAGRIVHSSAAHPRPCLVTRGEPKALPTGGPFIGLVAGAEFPEWETAFGAGDAFYTFTDGAFEEFDEGKRPFGEDRLHRALADAVRLGLSAPDELQRRLAAFLGGAPITDDVTVIGVRHEPFTLLELDGEKRT
jgi:serine phosphatase RsbU (regulator of sigma subunit)